MLTVTGILTGHIEKDIPTAVATKTCKLFSYGYFLLLPYDFKMLIAELRLKLALVTLIKARVVVGFMKENKFNIGMELHSEANCYFDN